MQYVGVLAMKPPQSSTKSLVTTAKILLHHYLDSQLGLNIIYEPCNNILFSSFCPFQLYLFNISFDFWTYTYSLTVYFIPFLSTRTDMYVCIYRFTQYTPECMHASCTFLSECAFVLTYIDYGHLNMWQFRRLLQLVIAYYCQTYAPLKIDMEMKSEGG